MPAGAAVRLTAAPLGAVARLAGRGFAAEVFCALTGFAALAALRELDFFAAFFGAAALRDGVFERDADFFAAFFFDGLAALREAVFFVVAFFRDAFFAAGLLALFFAEPAADFRAAAFFDDFLRAADLLFDVAFVLDFDLDFLGLTLRLLPVVFLAAAALRGTAFFLLVPALLRFLLAAFFAGIRTPAGSEKNAELYIACANMEA